MTALNAVKAPIRAHGKPGVATEGTFPRLNLAKVPFTRTDRVKVPRQSRGPRRQTGRHDISFRTPSYTAVMTTMDNLHRKGQLKRERRGKAFAYWPTWTREQYSARLMRTALDAGGDSRVVLTHLLE
ncbi:BlaI/MecI/CopY family transcriptional regulator [Amycolatopsis sp. H20-H5]|uniref:BlaI/MecI/CopY family transcriptional regulator n=1 Tax=Amycolatopsis sp. H20-H5 TaxID=3046309 RepID=UPI002DBC7CE7|nr:BlaI/MecI/CopY family transcriptional regulator [Amycolatopsis sp. H20-H5]MEC3982708.1 BlaI/MecI/CopY family transcriptional regulator [Amycolatopsis sp. H20-H5]